MGTNSIQTAAAVLLCFCILQVCAQANVSCSPGGSLYSLNATDLNMNPVQLSKYQGQVSLVINVASFWGRTVISYTELNQLIAQFPSGFSVLAFPSAQFLNQEPGKEPEILNILKYVRPGSGYVPDFPLMSKTTVNGDGTHPVWQFLKSKCGPTGPTIGNLAYISWSPVNYNDITWNFEKFLITKTGQVYKRYDPATPPSALVSDIKTLLAQ